MQKTGQFFVSVIVKYLVIERCSQWAAMGSNYRDGATSSFWVLVAMCVLSVEMVARYKYTPPGTFAPLLVVKFHVMGKVLNLSDVPFFSLCHTGIPIRLYTEMVTVTMPSGRSCSR